MTPPRLLPLALLALLALAPAARAGQGTGAAPPSELATIGFAAPDFTLPDARTGKARSLHEFARAKRPVALFFFCGCPACRAVANEWAVLRRGGALPPDAATVIVYSTADRAEACALAAASGLDPKRTAVLCDTGDLSVTQRLYHAEPCPRLFVLDPAGGIVYANTGGDEKPQTAPAGLLAARALATLQAAAETRGDVRS